MVMRTRHWLRLGFVGLVVSVASCSGATSTPTITPAASVPAPAATATGTPTAIPTAVVATPTTADTQAAASPDPAVDAYPLLAGYQGHFAGKWNDTTFATTGSMTWDITADPSTRTVHITVAVGGHFFGGAGGPPESIVLTHLGQGVISGHSLLFGDVSGTITPAGALNITLTNPPGSLISAVDITGTFTGGTDISMTYSVLFVAGGAVAKGTATLKRA
jgi:hypothetical protein